MPLPWFTGVCVWRYDLSNGRTSWLECLKTKMFLEQTNPQNNWGSDRVDVGYMQPRKLPGRVTNAPAKALLQGQRTMFLEHAGNAHHNVVPDVLPTKKNVLRICTGKCSGHMFRAIGFYVPGRCFF